MYFSFPLSWCKGLQHIQVHKKDNKQRDSSSEEEEDENQLNYSPGEETKDIAEDKSDDKLQQKKELWNGDSM